MHSCVSVGRACPVMTLIDCKNKRVDPQQTFLIMSLSMNNAKLVNGVTRAGL